MLLEDKNAIIYGGGGVIGGAVARAFAREGACVFIAGRTLGKLDRVASDIAGSGRFIEIASVDAQDEVAVDRYVDSVVSKRGSVDISFNAIDFGNLRAGVSASELEWKDIAEPLINATRSTFLTAHAAARHMRKRRSGVILTLAHPTGQASSSLPKDLAFGAIEIMARSLKSELGPFGVRVVCLQSTAVAEALASIAVLVASDRAFGITGVIA